MRHKRIKAIPVETTWTVYVRREKNRRGDIQIMNLMTRRVDHVLVSLDGFDGVCHPMEAGGYLTDEEERYWECEGLVTGATSAEAWTEAARLVGFDGEPGETTC